MDILSITKRRWSVLFFNILSMCFLKNTDLFLIFVEIMFPSSEISRQPKCSANVYKSVIRGMVVVKMMIKSVECP